MHGPAVFSVHLPILIVVPPSWRWAFGFLGGSFAATGPAPLGSKQRN